jgi:hypothetical protein
VPERISLAHQANQTAAKVGFGTMAAALAALSMAILGHFFI